MDNMDYNMKNLSDGLQELAHQLSGVQKKEIAEKELIHFSTVYEYMKGNIETPAIGQAILSRGRAMLIENAVKS